MTDRASRDKCYEDCKLATCEMGRNCHVYGTETGFEEIAAQLMTMVVSAVIIGAFIWKVVT